jgi:UDP-N-acetyl-D-glucosamine dehydrogenase
VLDAHGLDLQPPTLTSGDVAFAHYPRVSPWYDPLLEAIKKRTARVGIIGMGYVGLPLALAFSEAGFRVLGFDVDPRKVGRLQEGESYIGHIADGAIRCAQGLGFEATDRFARLDEPDAILICVPTPLTEARDPDLTFVKRSAQLIARRLRPGQLVVLESTTYPGTTRDVVQPILEADGARVGVDLFLAYSPEREDPGQAGHSARTIPKVVGGIERQGLELASALYRGAVDQVVPVSSCEVAEGCKILENTYRAVNIALVNELKVIYDRMGIDVWEVIEAAKTKPFGFQAFYPGPGLGGHCIPIDPFYLTWVARKYGITTKFIELAGEVNTAMPEYVVGKVMDALNERGKSLKGSRLLLLGMAYKPDVDDARESPGLHLMDSLLAKGARVEYNDPYIPSLPTTRRYAHLCRSSLPLTSAALADQDCVVVVTDHSSYDWPWVAEHAPLIVDTRNALRGVGGCCGHVVRA